jgi:hypothetical protein
MKSYAEQLPQGLATEDQILDQAYLLIKAQQGAKAARYYINYHEDFPADLISEYRFLQKEHETCKL